MNKLEAGIWMLKEREEGEMASICLLGAQRKALISKLEKKTHFVLNVIRN